MKIGILAVGQVAPDILINTAHGLAEVFPETVCEVTSNHLALPEYAFDKKRRQYNSTITLNDIRAFVTQSSYHRVLGIIDADIFSSGLNYVFGEAYVSGNAALISLWRLKPKFYGEEPDSGEFQLRTLKEAIHEVGHTLGLQHCPKSYCVMHFSNSIFEVDKKQSLFCDQCYLNAALVISNIGQQV
ncbi:MAG TPA: archaemetzincin family Zn-dependent metalloprotease [Candidatus Acidoferrales bacterium]|nr:archaemetzincin family Zn-dependent metalloprotease [Candidatus Acidoferrales bacterium]